MGRVARRRAIAAVLALALAALAALPGCGGGAASLTPRQRAQDAARTFLDRYAGRDGRVARLDQGGDTVSEGQAYGLLAALAAGDRPRFHRIWAWTRAHLRRGDGLLAWHWQAGRVTDAVPAADADLDAAHALLLAARRFREPALAAEARRMADAMRGQEIRDGVLLAGPWGRDAGVLNPSYFDPRALRALHMTDVEQATRRAVAPLVAAGGPPPDWATAGPPPQPAGPPGGGAPAYGYDAARVPVRLAASCDPRDRRLAAGLRGLDRAAAGDHPVFIVAQAAQAQAAGNRRRAGELLDRAQERDDAARTYYGAAWVALGRALLRTDLLGSCPGGR